MTTVYVTHDQAEALALADRIAVMERGPHRAGTAPPIEIFQRPANTFVANFIGNPPMNLLPVEARGRGRPARLIADGLAVETLPVPRAGSVPGQHLTLGVRPEHLVRRRRRPEHHPRRALRQREHGPEKLVTVERPDAARFTARIFTDELIAHRRRP